MDNSQKKPGEKSFTRAWEWVRRAVRVDPDVTDPAEKSDDPDWTRVHQLALAHGLVPLLFSRLKDTSCRQNRPDIFAAFRELYFRNIARNVKMVGELFRIFDLLAATGIQVVPVRGPVLAVRAFDDFGLRGFSDLDFFIRNRDISRALDLVFGAGYLPLHPEIRDRKKIYTRSGRDVTFQTGPFYLEFHQGYIQGPKFFSLGEDVWDNLASVKLMKRELPVLAAEDTVLALAIHSLHHGWDVLKGAADLAHFIHNQGDHIDWHTLIGRARASGCGRVLRIGLLLAQSICGLPLPGHVGDWLTGDGHARKWARIYEKQLFQKQSHTPSRIPFRAVPRALDTVRHKIRYLAHFIFNPTSSDLIKVPLPETVYFLYYIIRPLRLMVNGVREGITMIAKRLG